MRYYVKQRVFSIGDTYSIYDEAQSELYRVYGRIFTIGAKLELQDPSGNTLIYIEQELFRMLPRYNIYRGGQWVAGVRKRFQLFGSYFEVDTVSGSYTIEGEIFAHDFTILRDGRVAAVVTKRYLSWGDTYEIDIAPGEDTTLLLGLVIVLDNCMHNEN